MSSAWLLCSKLTTAIVSASEGGFVAYTVFLELCMV